MAASIVLKTKNSPDHCQHHYLIHGLRVMSELELPELASGDPGEPDVRIVRANVPATLSDPIASGQHWQAADGELLFDVEGVARYLVCAGSTISVDSTDSRNGRPGDVRLYLLGTALGALMHQRGMLPLHASAISTPRGSWAFTGPSGAGKSTLAAWLGKHHGWPVLSDDVIVANLADAQPRLEAGPLRMKLWGDALEALSIDREGLTRDLLRFDKFHLLMGDRDLAGATPFHALVVLENGSEGEAPQLARLNGKDALAAVMSAVYRAELAAHIRPAGELFVQSAALASRIKVYRFRRPRSLLAYDDMLRPLLELVKATT